MNSSILQHRLLKQWCIPLWLCFLYLAFLPTSASAQNINLARCEGLWFSTSEDFLSRGTDLPGGPVVSDGDLLTFGSGGSRLCARNEELLRQFDIEQFDHGLDALDQIRISDGEVLAAFSTELDSMHTQFSAGDLLFTNGIIVPNAALLIQFNIPRNFDMGLDAVSIVGEAENKRNLVERLRTLSREQLTENPGILVELLQGTDTDIWFSTEGTAPQVQNPVFLDGDLLSARDGVIIRSNSTLLPSLPAGLPVNGVDYGLDAFTPSLDPIEQIPVEIFSSEIQLRDRTYSDGDALLAGPSVYLSSKDLVVSFEPLDSDMGLDALAARPRGPVLACTIDITTLSDISKININQSSGLFDTDRPFGRWVRVQGIVPNEQCPEFSTHEFQVRVSVDGGPEQAILHPASLNWRRNLSPCAGSPTLYSSDPGSGWFSLTDYWRFNECPDDASLAYWNSLTAPGADTAVFRLAMRPIAGGAELMSTPVRIRVDNDAPQDLVAELYSPGAVTPFGDQCEIDGGGADVIIDIRGRVRDDHFSFYSLHWLGGDVHTYRTVPVTLPRTYNSRPDLSDTGTEPPVATNVPLGTLNLTAEYAAQTGGNLLIECGYNVRLSSRDRSHLGVFNPGLNSFGHVSGNYAEYIQAFCLRP